MTLQFDDVDSAAGTERILALTAGDGPAADGHQDDVRGIALSLRALDTQLDTRSSTSQAQVMNSNGRRGAAFLFRASVARDILHAARDDRSRVHPA
jgi:hypothetical protein